MDDQLAALPDDFFAGPSATTTGATIRELFRLFVKERGGKLGREYYARFCQATEGVGCDEARWASHCKALGVSDTADGMPIGHFGKLYTQKRFKKHFGKVRSELEKVKQFLTAPPPQASKPAAAGAEGGGAAAAGGGGGSAGAAGGEAAPRKPSRGSVLRVGASSGVQTVSFTEPGLLGIEWGPEVTLKPADAVREVLGELQAAAAASASGAGADKAGIVSRGDLHPNAGRHGDKLPPPPKGFAAFEPADT